MKNTAITAIAVAGGVGMGMMSKRMDMMQMMMQGRTGMPERAPTPSAN